MTEKNDVEVESSEVVPKVCSVENGLPTAILRLLGDTGNVVTQLLWSDFGKVTEDRTVKFWSLELWLCVDCQDNLVQQGRISRWKQLLPRLLHLHYMQLKTTYSLLTWINDPSAYAVWSRSNNWFGYLMSLWDAGVFWHAAEPPA